MAVMKWRIDLMDWNGRTTMPVNLSENEKLVFPEQIIPAREATKLWIGSVVLHVPCNGIWSAVTESHPIDDAGKLYYANPLTGKNTTVRIESNNLMADAAKSPALAEAINQVMAGIITATTEIKALRDAERQALEGVQNGEEISG
jgi:hypothetical protein